MMPVAEDFEEEYSESHIDYKQKYKALKKKLRLLVYEQECFLEELRKAQRKLLKVSRDRSFLLDRLLLNEKIQDSSEESDATNSTDTEEGHREAGPTKKRKLAASSSAVVGDMTHVATASAKQNTGAGGPESHPAKKKSKNSGKKGGKSSGGRNSAKQETPGHMTREELERHLESKQHFGIEKATASLPMEIFSNVDSADGGGEEEEDDLVIDVPH